MINRALVTIGVLLFCVGCATRSNFPAAIVRNDEHGIMKTLTQDQLSRIDKMIVAGISEEKKDNVEVWPDDTIWYRVYVYDDEGCFRLRYEFHPSFRKVKFYPPAYTLFPGSVQESETCIRLLEPAKPTWQPFDEHHYEKITDMFFPDSEWSGFR